MKNEAFDIICRIEERLDFDPQDTSLVPAKEINKFYLDCLESIRDDFPDVARDAITVAEDFCYGDASSQELEASREACWNYLKKKKIELNLKKKETCMVRAVICSLNSDFRACEIGDSLDFFADMMYRLGKGSTVNRLLIEHFLT